MSLVYNRKWDIFCTKCTERHIDPFSVSIGNLGDFLLFLFDDRNLAASAVNMFKAAILYAPSLRQPSPVPTWDIRLVLRAFSQAPFELLDSACLQAVYLIKCLFWSRS